MTDKTDYQNLLSNADPCPTCEALPVPTNEPAHDKSMLVVLRCPNGHPFTCGGDNLLMAINFWNHYIQYQVQQMTATKFKTAHINNNSFCSSCQQPTKTLVKFEKVPPQKDHLGYTLIKQQCQKCYLIKSQREAA